MSCIEYGYRDVAFQFQDWMTSREICACYFIIFFSANGERLGSAYGKRRTCQIHMNARGGFSLRINNVITQLQ